MALSKRFAAVIALLLSSNALANETVVAAIQAYASCLQSTYDVRIAANESKDAAVSEAFATCTTERSRIAATIPPEQVSSILARIDGIARTALTK